ncbi:MAG: ribulose-phosphate 3-epimerase [Terriglobia bacterium]
MPDHPTAVQLLREACPTISVGILSADLLALGAELGLLQRVGARIVHVDVMDGCYCPLMTVGPPFIKALKTPLLKDVHLMIDDPLEKVAEYVAVGSDIVTIHPEACAQPHRVLQHLRSLPNAHDPARGVVRGVAMNPGSPLEILEPLMEELELISLLAVNPGWTGQKFFPSTFKRIEKTQKMIAASGRDIFLCVDGGITKANLAEVARTGVDLIVAGSAIFDGKAAEQNARMMLDAVKS